MNQSNASKVTEIVVANIFIEKMKKLNKQEQKIEAFQSPWLPHQDKN